MDIFARNLYNERPSRSRFVTYPNKQRLRKFNQDTFSGVDLTQCLEQLADELAEQQIQSEKQANKKAKQDTTKLELPDLEIKAPTTEDPKQVEEQKVALNIWEEEISFWDQKPKRAKKLVEARPEPQPSADPVSAG